MPRAVSTPARRDSIRLLRVTIAKSGPGLMTANRVIVITAINSVMMGLGKNNEVTLMLSTTMLVE